MSREAMVVDKLADLAQGGMGSVEIGVVRDGRLAGRVLAIKRLHEEMARDEDVVSMFVDEAWLTAQIDDPHVVRVEAFCEDARGLFLATELVRGVSLGRLMAETRARGEPFAERTVAFIASQTCRGLAAAHDLRDPEGTPLGLVHRDLTPGNVLVSFDGVVKITDFGIAKAERRVTANTRMGVLKGKPSYVSPEQVRGGAIDARADLFALGIVLFELLAGRRPWRGKDDTDVLIAMMRTEPPRLAELRPNVSPVLGNLVDACIRKKPEDRPQSADEIRGIVDAFRTERGFASEDAASLAAFVARNTTELSAWFDDALGGALSKGGRSLQQAEEVIDQTRVQTSPLEAENKAKPAPTVTVEDETTSDGVATAAFQHDGPLPGAAAMVAAMRALQPHSQPQPQSEPQRAGADAAQRVSAATQFMPWQTPMTTPAVSTHDALARMASPPIKYSAKTEMLSATTPMHPISMQGPPPSSSLRVPSGMTPPMSGPASGAGLQPTTAAPGSNPISSSPLSPPRTEWLATPPSTGRGPAGATPLPRTSATSGSHPAIDPSTGLPATVSNGLLSRSGPGSSAASRSGAGRSRVVLVFVLVFIASVASVGALLRFGILKLP